MISMFATKIKGFGMGALFLVAALGCTQQKKGRNSMIERWFVAGETPAFEGKQLGYAGPSVGISGQKLLVIGGANFPEKMPWRGGAKRYYNVVNVFSRRADGVLAWEKSGQISEEFGYAATCTTPEGVAVVGGENAAGARADAAIYFWKNGEIQVKKLPNLPEKMTNGQLVFVDGSLIFAGGENAEHVSRAVWRLDLAKGGAWQAMTELPQATACGVMLERNGFLYMIGGRMRQAGAVSTFYRNVFAFDLASDKWSEKAPIPEPLAAGTGVVIDSKLVLLGGDVGAYFNEAEKLIHAVAAETDEAKKADLNEKKAQFQEAHPGFSKDVWAYDVIENSWQTIAKNPYPTQVTTGSVLWERSIYIANGEIRAGVRTPQITGISLSPPATQ